MKRTVTIILLLTSVLASGQNYKLFNAGSVKLFTTWPDAGQTFNLAFDSVSGSGNDSLFYPYRIVEQGFLPSETCQFWGPPDCRMQSKPIWAGSQILAGESGNYMFFTSSGDTLNFNTRTLPGNTSLLYEDDSQRFNLQAQDRDIMDILGITDSVASFRILHTDLQGIPINSQLNNQLLIIGKLSGLVRFFEVDSFPQVLQPINILGNSFPEAGLIRLTYGMIYDHQPGDEIEYLDTYNRPYGPPWENYTRYIKHVFLTRVDNEDTLSYSVARFTFYQDSLDVVSDTIQLTYQKNAIFSFSPYDKPEPDMFLEKKHLYLDTYFGLPLWSYQVEPEHLVYCVEDNCWGQYDTQGPPVETNVIHVLGLGEYLNSGWQFGAPPYGYGYGKRIIYFKKNGLEYGNEVVVGTTQHPLPQNGLTVYPNPAGDKLFIRADISGASVVQISDAKGVLLRNYTMNLSLNRIDIADFKPGLYFVRILCENQFYTIKFIKN